MNATNIFTRWGLWLLRHFPLKTIEQALGVQPAVFSGQVDNIQKWAQSYAGEAEQNTRKDCPVPSLQIPKQVCNTVARNVVVGLESEIQTSKPTVAKSATTESKPENNPFNDDWQRFIKKRVYSAVNAACGYSEIIFYPTVHEPTEKVDVKFTDARNYFPVRYNTLEELEAVIFVETLQQGDDWYTLYTVYDWREGTQYIWRKAYMSANLWDFGKPVPLSNVAAWQSLQDDYQRPTSRPWFVELTAPNKEAIFHSAIDMIREAEEQDARATWDNKAKEAAVFAAQDTFRDIGTKISSNTNHERVYDLPKGQERLYQVGGWHSADVGKPMEVYAPPTNNIDLRKRYSDIARHIENIIGLSRGNLSDPEQTMKTATEVNNGELQFVVTVETFREILTDALTKLAVVVGEVAAAYGFYPAEHDLTVLFGDFTSNDTEDLAKFNEEWRGIQTAVNMGMEPELALAWFYENHPSLFKVTPEAIAAIKKYISPPEPESEFESGGLK